MVFTKWSPCHPWKFPLTFPCSYRQVNAFYFFPSSGVHPSRLSLCKCKKYRHFISFPTLYYIKESIVCTLFCALLFSFNNIILEIFLNWYIEFFLILFPLCILLLFKCLLISYPEFSPLNYYMNCYTLICQD